MKESAFEWDKIGLIFKPNKKYWWISSYTGAVFAKQIKDSSIFELFVTGRDDENRSHIGVMLIDIKNPTVVLNVSENPIFSPSEPGCFDENGVSYPWLFEWEGQLYMLYVGWMPTVLTPFMNAIGIAKRNSIGVFERVSRAPILHRNNDDFLSIGSSCIFVEDGLLNMYYTSFLKWGQCSSDHKHYYVIKHAKSENLFDWKRNNDICINISNENEFSICRPNVLFINGLYHMWYSYRGNDKSNGYLIGYARSNDGVNWERLDEKVGITLSEEGWDSKMICYSHVFTFENKYYMIYNGNEYGKDGFGIAKLRNTEIL